MTSPVRSATPPRTRLRIVAVLIGLLLVATGCGSDTPDPSGDAGNGAVTVLAAASLTEVFEGLGPQLEDREVSFSFGSSTTLAEQAGNGAPGDVLATADRAAMDLAVQNGAVSADPVQFATNQLVLAVPADNPAGIEGLADLAGTDWVRCADEVPCGRVAVTLLERAGLADAEPASLEVDVKAALAKVVAGEADAALVYATDAVAAGAAVTALPVEGAEEELNTYWVAPLADGDTDAADAWIDLLTSPVGVRALDAAGFGPGTSR